MLFRSVSQSRYGGAAASAASSPSLQAFRPDFSDVGTALASMAQARAAMINAEQNAALTPYKMQQILGDDSLIYLPKGLEYPDIQATANLVWNFEAKLFRRKYGYFCGKYIIHHANGCIVYPDPYRDWETDRKSTRLNSSHRSLSRMPSSA